MLSVALIVSDNMIECTNIAASFLQHGVFVSMQTKSMTANSSLGRQTYYGLRVVNTEGTDLRHRLDVQDSGRDQSTASPVQHRTTQRSGLDTNYMNSASVRDTFHLEFESNMMCKSSVVVASREW